MSAPTPRYTMTEAKKGAKRYATRAEFKQQDPSLYHWVMRYDLILDVCSHMPDKLTTTTTKR